MDNLDKRRQLEILRSALENERSSFRSHWGEIANNILPRRAQFTVTDTNRGYKRNQKIIDETGTLAARTLAAGMQGGITSPARPWFRLTTQDPDLAESGPVKEWLHLVGQRMGSVFLRSNIYNALPTVYGDIGTFGTAAMAVEEDFDKVIRCYPFSIGSYCLATNDKLQVDVFYRTFRLTVRQVVQKFARRDRNGQPDWSNISVMVKNLYDKNNYEEWIDINHVIQPNLEFNPKVLTSQPYESIYYEAGAMGSSANYMASEPNKFLRQSGYKHFPVLAPRWEVSGEDIYGTNCPGMLALSGIKHLQLGEKRTMQAIEKKINPPMIAPISLRKQSASILPGDITYVDEREGIKGFRPAHEVNFDIQPMEVKQEQIRQRIRKSYFEDLFLMFANMDRADITATEINARREEKLVVLGPVLEQLNQDLYDPLIDLTFEIMDRQGLIPPPPEELQGQELKVEYISIMHQAQKASGLAGLERITSFIGQIAQVKPDIMDKIDGDQLIDEYGMTIGAPPRIIRTDEQVAAIRGQRAQAEQQARQAEALKNISGAAKNLSGADMSGDNALTRMVQLSQAGSLT